MRTIPDAGFAGDDGAPDPALADALAAYARNGRSAPAVVELGRSRLLVPVVAVLGESGADERGRSIDKSADMAAVSLTGRDGRRALLVFTGTEAMRAWDGSARPVPVTAQQAASAARAEAATALMVDVAGPVRMVVEADDLGHLAAGQVLVAVGDGHGWVSPG
ncbi:MAG: SseB family protein [Actinomycetota bacterium]|nr:SseB family protein [Actinomycetota bacterium]